MPNTSYFNLPYFANHDPASQDVWAPSVIDIFNAHDNAIGRGSTGGTILAPEAGTLLGIMVAPRFPCTIKSMIFLTDAGTITVAAKINGTPITSLSAVAVTSTPTHPSATGANTMTAEDVLYFDFSSVSGVNALYYAIWFDRTGAGTA